MQVVLGPAGRTMVVTMQSFYLAKGGKKITTENKESTMPLLKFHLFFYPRILPQYSKKHYFSICKLYCDKKSVEVEIMYNFIDWHCNKLLR